MARVLNIEIPNNKAAEISLTYIYGIGKTTARKICEASNVDGRTKIKDLTDEQLTTIRAEAAKFKTEGDLRREIQYNIKRVMVVIKWEGNRKEG